jgi:L-arabinose isomerase
LIDIKNYEVWFVTGSQYLYGKETLKHVAANSEKIVKSLNDSKSISIKVMLKPVMTNPESICKLYLEANNNPNCIGLITWMHTFSPARMWISGLNYLKKPFLHLHTQFNRDIPWSDIDMNFMNLNQSAHGGREFGFICSRMRINRKVVVGHWKDEEVLKKIDIWLRVACAWADSQGAKIARFGDNMREVAVTEGNKVSAQIKFGYSVNGYGLGDLVKVINKVSNSDIDKLIKEYKNIYKIMVDINSEDHLRALKEAAKIEIGMRNFLENGGFKAFTTNFENLYGLYQLPGIAVQRLMGEGYGFGAEGDWKTASLVRAMKVMSLGLDGGNSFMEDYTYHLEPGSMKVLGAHMLEVCESIASKNEKISIEVHPLSIGRKSDPPRLVFNVSTGHALNACIIDLGNRFRMIVNEVEVVEPDAPLPKLHVTRVIWAPKPDLKTAAAAWILAGGAHHTSFSQVVTAEYLEDYAEIAGIEYLLINNKTDISEFKKELKLNEIYYYLSQGIK